DVRRARPAVKREGRLRAAAAATPRDDRKENAMDIQQIETDPDPYAPYLLSQGVRIGDMLLVSGQVGIDDAGELVSVDEFETQADQAFRNLGRVLEAGGSSLERVAKVAIF